MFNRENLIGETLSSVLSQSHSNWECIIVDDGSTDNSVNVVEQYCQKDNRFKLYLRPKHLPSGGNSARNFGFEQSTGDFIQWFDSDDIMLIDYLKSRLDSFKEKTQFVICTGFTVNQFLGNRDKISIYTTDNLFKEYVLWNLKIMTPSILFKRKFLNEKILFRENLLRGQETELFSRLFFKLLPKDYLIINEPLYLYRQHDGTKSRTNKYNYIVQFKQSLSFVAMENLKRGIQIHDKEIIDMQYLLLVTYFFQAIHMKDSVNVNEIFKNLLYIIGRLNLVHTLYFSMVFFSFTIFKRSIYFFEKYLKTHTL